MTNLPPIIKVSTITPKYIYHFADIHIKPNSRHAEYTEIFNQVIQNISADSVLGDRLAIFAGDITDHKEKLNSAQIICLQNFFVKLSKLCPILVIIGNHDFIEGSDNDNLTPILFGLPNLTYARDSGLYIYGQVGFCVNSLYDNKFYSAEECDKVNDQLHTLIAIYHGMVGISFGGQTTTRSKQKEDFNNFDLVLLGDIHKRSYLNSEKTIAYCGSLIQQNYGEPIEGHGYLIWNVDNLKATEIDVKNNYGFVNLYLKKDEETKIQNFPKIARLNITLAPNVLPATMEALLEKIIKSGVHLEEVKWQQEYIQQNYNFDKTADAEKIIDNILPEDPAILEYHKKLLEKIPDSDKGLAAHWELKKIAFTNTFAYGDDIQNVFDVSTFPRGSIIGLLGANATGKTSLLNTIQVGLYGADTGRGEIKLGIEQIMHRNKVKLDTTIKTTLRIRDKEYEGYSTY